jgi:fucose permease
MLFLIGLAPSRTMAVVGLLLYGGFMLMTYPSLHTFVGSTVPLERQTQAFCWFSNLQLVSGAFVSLASGFLSDAWGIHAPFLITGFLTLVVFLYYLPRGQQLDVFVSGS